MRSTHHALFPKTRAWLSLAACALLACPAFAAEPLAPTAREATDTFRSGGKDVRVERFEPTADGKYPALVLLHPIDGLDNASGEVYRGLARDYAAKGYVVALVHYFDRTDAAPEELKAVRALFLRRAAGEQLTDAQRKTIEGRFDAWTDTVRDAVADVRKRPNVDPDRVGLVGLSLGGFLALSVAAQEDMKIAAVVDLFGGLPAERRAGVKTLPPVLVLHGDKDTVVSVDEAKELQKLIADKKLVGEVTIYPGVGHVFMDEKGRMSLQAVPALMDARARAEAFLEKHLKTPKTDTGRETDPHAASR
jgi:carboxymethylenebutenolidase